MRFPGKLIVLILLVAAIAAALIAAMPYLWINERVAIQPAATEAQASLQAIARDAANQNRWIKFERVPVASMREAAAALADNKADLAILRSDIAFPAVARTIAIMRRDDVFLIVPPKSPIESFRGLRNQKIAMAGAVDNGPLLDNILKFYGVEPANVTRVAVPVADLGNAIRDKRIAAVLVVGVPGKGVAAEAYAAVAKATKGAPGIIGMDEADAVAARFPSLTSSEIPQGAFANGKAPDDAVTTVSVAYHLVASSQMTEIVGGELTRMLLSAKIHLLGDPGVAGIEAPDTSQAIYAVHPGAKEYVNDALPTLSTRFLNVFWITSAITGIFGTIASWTVGRIRGRKDAEESGLNRLAKILEEVRVADASRLTQLQEQLDQFVLNVLTSRGSDEVEVSEMVVLQLAIAHIWQAIATRRELHELK